MSTINYLQVPTCTISFKDPEVKYRTRVMNSKEAYDLLLPVYEDCLQHHEEFHVMMVNRQNKVIGIIKISQGGISETSVDIRIIMQALILSNAAGVFLSHNHPSGNLKPSLQDKAITEKIKKACDIFDFTVLDHIIVGIDEYYSFADEGAL